MSISSRKINLKRASAISGYHPDYLSSLIRTGKLGGNRIGRDWFTTEGALKKYLLNRKFFSIKEIVFSKLSKAALFSIIFILFLIAISAYIIYQPKTQLSSAVGEFLGGSKTQRADFLLNETGGEAKQIKVTSYVSDDSGNVGLSIDAGASEAAPKQEKSFVQKLSDFLKGK